MRLYVDLDGVLVDWLGEVVKMMNKDKNPLLHKLKMRALNEVGYYRFTEENVFDIAPNKSGDTKKYMTQLIGTDENWWANLPWTKNGKKLWEEVKKYNPYILSSPMLPSADDGKSCVRGKYRWVQKNLDIPSERVFIERYKYVYATNDGKPNILIDDFVSQVDPFIKKGGVGILHTDDNWKMSIDRLFIYKEELLKR